MKRIVVALATADHHIHKFQAFNVGNSRLEWGLKALNEIFYRANLLDVPILFAGDLIHSPKNIETETNLLIQQLFKSPKNLDVDFIAISGNHDMSERNAPMKNTPSHLDSIIQKNFFNLKFSMKYEDKNMIVDGIPYMNNDSDLKKEIKVLKDSNQYDRLKILLLHTDLPGATTPEGFKIGELESIPSDLDKFFKNWDLVLCGHIHKAQKLSKKVYMLGCPIQQNAGDINGGDHGYWEIYNDGTVKLIPMDDYPKFIRLKKGEEPKDEFNYYIKPEEVLVDEEVKLGEFNINNSKSKLAKRYCALRQIKSKTKRRALIKILNEE